MSDAFAPIVRARPCPIFVRPVHQRSPPFDYSPILLLKPFGFRITPDTLSSSEQTRWPARHYPCLWIQRPSSERRRDFNPPDSCAAQRTLRRSRAIVQAIGPLFRLVIEFGYLAIVLPKFNVVAVNKLLCLFPSFAIVSAVERNKVLEMAVPADDVNSILRHMRSPDQAGAQHSQSPIEADGGTVMGTCSHVSWSALWSIVHLAKSLAGKLVRNQKGPILKIKRDHSPSH